MNFDTELRKTPIKDSIDQLYKCDQKPCITGHCGIAVSLLVCDGGIVDMQDNVIISRDEEFKDATKVSASLINWVGKVPRQRNFSTGQHPKFRCLQ